MEWLTLELTNHCNKKCWFCGRADARTNGLMHLGDISFQLLKDTVEQFNGSVIQFSKDGEPLLYDELEKVGALCKPFTTNIVTNGIMLNVRRKALIDNFTSIIVSVFEDDEEQFSEVAKFLKYRGDRGPLVYAKFLGDYYNPEYKKLGLKTTRRSLHRPNVDTGYIQSKPVIPEVGVCLDFLYKPSVDWQGNLHICNRYDPYGRGVLGSLREHSLDALWKSEIRREWLLLHKKGMRDAIQPCRGCEYWGYPAYG